MPPVRVAVLVGVEARTLDEEEEEEEEEEELDDEASA